MLEVDEFDCIIVGVSCNLDHSLVSLLNKDELLQVVHFSARACHK